ncbi:MBL fold metallo-hydrolase [Frankia sp. CNm7]|uniref:MBL fold metallo-hydrolase n=1 Tax=Frankia nepalensis TaxID=1836974 RepID=A0A937RDT6_9ACTN|nr:MBL fold metallo-hydrolase [Frankia nepalensis]MBL7500583.1 MBL fold metallo-hydrolase [Frankia nepalensis]MBL7509363.1 MBL fold metallo-hydrolase [Frankia nepalensis]MBL7519958.1 MBL fold metallo-hydrolase [Frankia nepalensis]MBL7630321.1 MBL fold metallo-hydrolase [Frankia nepalensis]
MAEPDPWFMTRRLREGVWLVAEPWHVYCFLVVGTERAVLIDTGTGIADISAPVRRITGLPVLVVNTHAHDDHRGGNVFFDEVAAHPVAVERLALAVPADRVGAYLTVATEQLAAYETTRALDDRYFHLFTAETRPRPLPPGVHPATAAPIASGPAARPLADGDVIDLGGRALRVLHSPGHSPDSLCLFDERDGLLFVGDTLITGDFWAHTDDTDLEAFVTSLRRLDGELAGQVARVMPAHTRSCEAGPHLLRDAADAIEATRAGHVGEPGVDLYGRPVLRHRFAEFNILRPAA